MKIYTKRGDDGRADLLGGLRAHKDDDRFKALGDLDELSAWLGLLKYSSGLHGDEIKFIAQIQEDLVILMSHVSALNGKEAAKYEFPTGLEIELEKRVDLLAKNTEFDGSFTKAANETAAKADITRTICRRAERSLATLGWEYPLSVDVLKYINRLSDYLYMLVITPV